MVCFLALAATLWLTAGASPCATAETSPRVLVVIALPDDEGFAGALQKIADTLRGGVGLAVITNGERYAVLDVNDPAAIAKAQALFARRSSPPPATPLPGGQAAWPLLGQGVCPIPR